MDGEARAIEVWALAAGAAEPIVLGPGERLRWSAGGDAAVLEIDVEELLAR